MTRLDKFVNLCKEMNVDAILLTSEVNMHYATMYRGLEGIVVIGKDGESICFTDSRYIEDATKKIEPYGYRVLEPEGSYPTPKTIIDYVKYKGYNRVAFEDYSTTVNLYDIYKNELTAELVPVEDKIEKIRAIKEDSEIEWITEAQRIAERSLNRLLPEIKVGTYENELCSKLRYYMALEGSSGVSPGMILISGARTSMPHGRSTHKQIHKGDFVTIDFGAEVNGYKSDMTRTFAVGSASDEMRHVYSIVLEAQLAGIEAFSEGKTGNEVDAVARDIIIKKGFGQYFGHGLGHSIGLEMHENPRARKDYYGHFENRNIITVEPGIYIPGKFGVRIEDMIYLSPKEKVNLTEFSKELVIL